MIFTIAFALIAAIGFSQTTDDYVEIQRSVIKTEKKAVIAEVMQLTEQEAKDFWPLYEEYENKQYEINTQIYQLIKKYADEYETLTNEEAIKLWKEKLKFDKDLNKVESVYFKKFMKILPGKKLLTFFQAENKIRTLIMAELANQIPMAIQK
jgi:hypothetical protein